MSLHTIHVPLRASTTLRLLSLVGHLVAIGTAVWLTSARPFWWAIAAALLVDLVDLDRRLARRTGSSWQTLRWSMDNRIQWQRRDGRSGQGECIRAGALGAAWVVLRIRRDERWTDQWLFLPWDATTPDAHRRLRVRCRVSAPQHAAAGNRPT